ncbi:MAG: flagellar assembly protein FliH [Lamprobacter sp.]|uniref:flagellar assembly protein FliH n=1 Tax=Lamprobacter sp. TaxID=3100796 RepID=UPI002B259674|nr:flagellar assembly protein FliH [Lamprobacter sp.]MEA3639205.1 flagellar assembly protein FliH [Lamprobacter sp.]
MSEADAKIRREEDVPWQRWQMTELSALRQQTADKRRVVAGSGSRSTARASAGGAAQPGPAQTQTLGTAAARPDALGSGAAAGAGAPAKAKAQGTPGQQGESKARGKSAQSAETGKPPRQANAQKQALEAERQRALETARKQGHAQGVKAGHAEGLKTGHAEGYAKGLEEGQEAARQAWAQQVDKTLKPVRNLALQFSDALALLDEEMAKDLVELALATGRQLAGEALDATPTYVVDLVRGLLHSEPAMHGKPRLWLHPQDHDLVSEYLGQELEAAGWALQPDDQVSRGGCRVTSASGELDATWESRWQTVRQQVRGRRSASEQRAAAQALLDAAEADDEPEARAEEATASRANG